MQKITFVNVLSCLWLSAYNSLVPPAYSIDVLTRPARRLAKSMAKLSKSFERCKGNGENNAKEWNFNKNP